MHVFLKTYVFEKCTCLKTYVFESCTRVTSVEVLLKHFDDLFPISARMEKKSALCVFGERKRPVLYDSSDDWENEKGNLMEANIRPYHCIEKHIKNLLVINRVLSLHHN